MYLLFLDDLYPGIKTVTVVLYNSKIFLHLAFQLKQK